MEIAKTDQARFEWWVQTKFTVLPTDERYINLTQEQLDLMWEHFKIDNPMPESESETGDKDNKYRDDDYDKEEKALAHGDTDSEEDVKDRLPKLDFETYADPDFDEEWNRDDDEEEILDNEFIPENGEEEQPPMFEEVNGEEPKGDTSLYKGEQWTEV